jgi:hypothetical protein
MARQHYTADDLKVLTIKQWAALNAISLWSAKKLLREGNGPPLVQLTSRRVGVRVIDNARWQEARLRD